jgi:hypothetical protein
VAIRVAGAVDIAMPISPATQAALQWSEARAHAPVAPREPFTEHDAASRRAVESANRR